MTANDIKLIHQADQMIPAKRYWMQIAQMENLAESQEAKDYLHRMAVTGYHNDEADCGML